ncbi:MAG: ChbG/HpnK family deacetylase, partial [Actinomycetota bacterium]
MRTVIVNADDFGLSAGVNAGIIRAHEHGIVTSTTMMVRQPFADEAARCARTCPTLAVGLHVDLGEWAFADGAWAPVYQRVDLSDASAVADEVTAQVTRFVELVGRPPTHLDSHQHVHTDDPVRTVVIGLAEQLHVPLRHHTPGIRYEGGFYGQTETGEPFPELVSAPHLRALLRDLPDGVTELACHPAAAADVATAYIDERLLELDALCDPSVSVART